MGLVRSIEVNTTTIGNVGGGLDPLHSFSLPANSLRNDGDYLTVWYGGEFANTANTKSVAASFGGTTYEGGGVLDLRAIGWTLIARIVRLSSTSVRVGHSYIAAQIFADSLNAVNTFGTGGFDVSRSMDILGLPDLTTNATSMEVFGQGVADNDVVQNLSIIELVQN